MEYVWKELHNDQEYYWPTIYRAGAALVSTITNIIKLYKACESISVDILSFALELEEN